MLVYLYSPGARCSRAEDANYDGNEGNRTPQLTGEEQVEKGLVPRAPFSQVADGHDDVPDEHRKQKSHEDNTAVITNCRLTIYSGDETPIIGGVPIRTK